MSFDDLVSLKTAIGYRPSEVREKVKLMYKDSPDGWFHHSSQRKTKVCFDKTLKHAGEAEERILGPDFAECHNTIPILEKIFGINLKTSKMLLAEQQQQQQQQQDEKDEATRGLEEKETYGEAVKKLNGMWRETLLF